VNDTTAANDKTAVSERRIGPAEWDGAIADVAGPQLVVGGPGTGKTEFLVRRAAHLVDAGHATSDRLLLLSFGRRGVADLEVRLRAHLPQPTPPVAVVTFHSLAAGIVEAHAMSRGWRRPPQILTGPEQTALVRELLADEDPSVWSPAIRPALATATLGDELTDFVLRSAEQMLDAEAIERRAAERNDWRGIPGFMARYRQVLMERGRIDYGLLLAEATALAEDGISALTRYSYVLVDEYQDTTAAQARLLAALVRPHRNIIVAADPYQSIYSFRGAALHNVARFPTEFTDAADRPATRIVLTTSFRTPREILAAAERITSGDLPGAAGPVTPAPGAGRVDVHVFDQHTEEAEWIAAEIVRLHIAEGVPLAAMAVLVRSTRRFVAELTRALRRRGVVHDPPTLRLAEQPAARLVLDLVAATTAPDPASASRAWRRVLLGPWFHVSLGAVRDLERATVREGLSWVDAVRRHLPGATALADLVADATWATERPAAEGVWTVWSALPQLAVVANEPDRTEERAAWASLTQVLTRWNERNPTASLVAYRRLLLDEEFEARPLLSYSAPGDDRLTVTTLHQAKGLERQVVFIADAVEGVFPDLRVRDSLLGVRHLLPDVPSDAAAYRRFRLQEERRLAYTAMTRATKRVVITATATGFEEGRGIPSRFLALAAGTATVAEAITPPPRRTDPVTIGEAEAMMRRIAADPAAPAPHRLAAIDILANSSEWGMRSPWRFAGLRDPGPDRGLVDPTMPMSPSQAEAYLECPRRYALQRRLGIADHPGLHAALGGLVHGALETAERAALEAKRPRATLDDAMAALADRFDPAVFGGEPEATAWLRRARVVLESLYTRWPSTGRVVDVERRLNVTIGDVSWVGIADRIEERNGALAIVDYKTGGAAVPMAEAAESLQLGFYLLAVAANEELCRHGHPTTAEAWFPYASRMQNSVAVRPFDSANLPAVVERLQLAAAGIGAERWGAVPSPACERCPVRTVCPAHSGGKEGFVA